MRETKTYIYFLRLRIFSNIMSISRMGNLIYFSSNIATGSNGYFLPGTKISLKMLQCLWYAQVSKRYQVNGQDFVSVVTKLH